MSTDIPSPAAMGAELLIDLATQGIAAILKAFHKNGAAGAAEAASGVALAILQETATIQGLQIDWTDPSAVQSYVATLPVFTPIPAPAPGPPIIQETPAAAQPTSLAAEPTKEPPPISQ